MERTNVNGGDGCRGACSIRDRACPVPAVPGRHQDDRRKRSGVVLAATRLVRRGLIVGVVGALALSLVKIQAQEGSFTLRLAAVPIPGATAQSPVPDPVSLPLEAADARDLIENLFVGLFRYDAPTRRAVPVLAREWTVSADGLTWTFTLRDDIPWVGYNPASGEVFVRRPVTADDVVEALRRACHPLRPSPASPAVLVIQGCYTAAQADPLLITDERVAGWVGAEAPTPATLVLRLAFPTAYLPALLTQPEFRPVPREFVTFTPAWPTLVSDGPYVLAAWEPGQTLTLVRNPHWPEPLPGNIGPITITYEADDAARAALFARGAVDFARLGAGGPDLRQQRPDAVQVWRGSAVTVLGFSTERAFVNQLGVRQALAWALDRERLAASDPFRLPITTFTPPAAIAGPPADAGISFEPEAARDALAAAGFPNCQGVPEIIQVAVPQGQEALGDQIIAQWTATLNCGAGLFEVIPLRQDRLVDLGRGMVDFEHTTRPHIWIAPWSALTLDAQGGAADAFHCRFGYFYSGLPCGPVDALIDWAAATVSGDGRPDVYAHLEGRLFGPAGLYPAVPLWADAVYVGVAAGLSGVGDYGPAWWGEWNK